MFRSKYLLFSVKFNVTYFRNDEFFRTLSIVRSAPAKLVWNIFLFQCFEIFSRSLFTCWHRRINYGSVKVLFYAKLYLPSLCFKKSNIYEVCSLPDSLSDDVKIFAIRWFVGTENDGLFCKRSKACITLSCWDHFLLWFLKNASSNSATTDLLMSSVLAITYDTGKGPDLLLENSCSFAVAQRCIFKSVRYSSLISVDSVPSIFVLFEANIGITTHKPNPRGVYETRNCLL